ncbi:MAG: signal peptidase I [Solirubrobacterales bacterium]
MFELVVIVALAIGLALGIQAFVVKPYQIPSESMVPTLQVGQRVLVNRVLFHFTDPQIGDIVVFNPPIGADRGNQCAAPDPDPGKACSKPTPEASDTNFIKRVVAEPGDRLRIEEGIPIVNGEPQTGDGNWTTRPCGRGNGCNWPEEIVSPEDHYFMMGDNRGASDDSRFWGPVPRDQIIGKAFLTYWPPKEWGIF